MSDGTGDGEREQEERVEAEPTGFGHDAGGRETIPVKVGRGQTADVQVGAPFEETINGLAEDAHYGGYYRVFLNGEEILEPTEAPETIQLGMRIAITSYDKVGK